MSGDFEVIPREKIEQLDDNVAISLDVDGATVVLSRDCLPVSALLKLSEHGCIGGDPLDDELIVIRLAKSAGIPLDN